MRLVGCIQGPVELQQEFTTALEVVFVFDRPLREWELWDSEVLRELAVSAVEVRAYHPNHNTPTSDYQQDYNSVSVKVR